MFATTRRWLVDVVRKVLETDATIDPVCVFCGATPVTDRSVSDYQCSRTMFVPTKPIRVVVILVNADTDDPMQTCLDCMRMTLLAATASGFSGGGSNADRT